jgi:sulfide:quinone oxidoreductase
VTTDDFSVLIAGGGVAALEAALTLRETSEDRARVERLAPEPTFWYRPVAVAEPFGLGTVRNFDLGRLADDLGAGLSLGSLASVDVDRCEARSEAGATLRYDALLIACGAVPHAAVPGGVTFRGPSDSERIRELLGALEGGDVDTVGFVVPWGATWSLPAYELALMTAAFLHASGRHGVEIAVVTPELHPLQLFGHTASEAVRALLDEAGVAFVGGAYAVDHVDGRLGLLSGDSLAVDRVVALPRLKGQRIDGIPQTLEGFVEIDEHCRVRGTDNVFAAGDITSFPVKQGGIAAQQAVAAAEAIAVLAGASLVPHPFRPILRGLLLTGAEPQYLRRDLSGGEEPDWASSSPIWWPPTKIVGRRLAPYLAALTGEMPVTGLEPPAPGVPVDLPLDPRGLELGLSGPDVPPASAPGEARPVGTAMRPCPPLIGPETSIAEAARGMRQRDVGSVLVVEGESLVGILTARDVLRAVAHGVSPGVTAVGRWMTTGPITVTASAKHDAAETLMTQYGIHQLPVEEGDRPVGIVGLREVTRSRRPERLTIGLGF